MHHEKTSNFISAGSKNEQIVNTAGSISNISSNIASTASSISSTTASTAGTADFTIVYSDSDSDSARYSKHLLTEYYIFDPIYTGLIVYDKVSTGDSHD